MSRKKEVDTAKMVVAHGKACIKEARRQLALSERLQSKEQRAKIMERNAQLEQELITLQAILPIEKEELAPLAPTIRRRGPAKSAC